MTTAAIAPTDSGTAPASAAEQSIHSLRDETLVFLETKGGDADLVELVGHLQLKASGVELLSRAIATLLAEERVALTSDRRIVVLAQ